MQDRRFFRELPAENRLPYLVNLTNFPTVVQVTIHQAKTQLSKLIAAVERGEEVIIARRDKRVARIVAEKEEKPLRVLGFLASRKVKLDGFFDPALDARIAGDFYPDAAADSAHPDHVTHDDHEQGA